MSELNEADDQLLGRIIDLTRLSEQDAAIITGYMSKITRLEIEAENYLYVDQTLERAQQEIIRLENELGR